MALISKIQMKEGRLPLSLIPECGACGLHKENIKTPKMPVSGNGQKRILVVGQSPTKTDDDLGRPFSGESGQIVRDAFLKAGVNFDRDCYHTNAIICHPTRRVDKSVQYCRANLIGTIKQLDPVSVILLGRAPIASLIEHVWGEKGNEKRWVGKQIPCTNPNAWILPNYAPTDILVSRSPLTKVFFEKYIKEAVAKDVRPWKNIPDFNKEITVELNPDKALPIIKSMQNAGKPIAFDYETNMLKPDSKRAKIACVAFSDGARTIATIFNDRVANATCALITSGCPLVGWNIGFESRWSKRILKKWPRNWIYDGMLANHVSDFQAGVTGLKFQSFVLFGAPDYAKNIKPYLVSEGGAEAENKVFTLLREDPRSLLLYCGIDAFLEWKAWDVCKDTTHKHYTQGIKQ